MDKNLHQIAKAPMIALINPQAPKGRPDINHGCNPWAEATPANHGCNPCAQTQDVHGCNPCAETPTQHKGKPRLLLLLLALVAIATTVQAQSVVTYVERDGVAYKLWNDYTASIPFRLEHQSLSGTLTLHQTITHNGQNYTLTKIEDIAFSNAHDLEGTLTIPPTVTYIGYKAFYSCRFRGELIIPNSVVTIDGEAFVNNPCSSLIVGDGVTSIGNMAFWKCTFSSVVLGANVQTIDDSAFGLHTLSTQDMQVECRSAVPPALGTNVFQNRSVPQVTAPPCGLDAYQASTDWNGFNLYEKRINVQIDGVYYVLHCSSKTALVTHAGYMEDNSNLGSYSGDVTIPETVTHEGETYDVTRIGDNAFRNCTSLNSIVIGDNVTSIGNYAFWNCTSLTSITINNPVPPALGEAVFYGLPATAVLNVPSTAMEAYAAAEQWRYFFETRAAQIGGVYYLMSLIDGTATVTHAGYTETNTNNGSYSGEVTIPATVTYEGQTYNVTRIGEYAFCFCYSLASVTLGDNVRDIGDRAFYNCSMLASVTLGKKVRDIGIRAFNHCSTLASVNLGDNVRDIGDYAFYNCSMLASVTFGKNVQIIGNYAFQDCTSLASVTLGDNVQRIKSQAFCRCTSLETVVLGKALQRIGNSAFSGCTALASITSMNPTPPTLSGNNVFNNVPSSAVLYVPCTATEAYAAEKWNVFSNMEGLSFSIEVFGTYYEIPCDGSNTATVIYDPSYATLYYAGIEDFEYMGSQYTVTAIADGAFDGLSNLEGINCHSNISSIGANAFRNCTGIMSFGFYHTDTPPIVGEGAFEGLGLDTLWLMVPFCSQYEYSQHPVFGQFGTITGNGVCEYNFYNEAGDKQWSNPTNWQDANFETCTEAPGAGARVAIFEDCEIGEDVTVGSVTIGNYIDEEWGYYERLTLKDGATLTATNFIYTTGDERNFIIEDGAQVVHTNAGAEATVKKAITAYSTQSGVNNGWHLIALPLTGSIDVDSVGNLIGGEYDLYAYDESTAYWTNRKTAGSDFAALEATKGYLYAHGEDVTLEFSGTLQNSSATISVPLSYTTVAHLSGFNLVGNPFPCNAYLDREYYVLSANGTEINPVAIPSTVPVPPCTAVFVKALSEGDSAVFTRVAP